MPDRAALVRHPLAIAGAILTTVAAVLFIALTIAILADLLANPYAGLIVFVALPALFLIGLLLIPAGMWLQRRKLERDPFGGRRLAGPGLPARARRDASHSSSRR